MPNENYKINTEFNFDSNAVQNANQITRALQTMEAQNESTHRSFLSTTAQVASGMAKRVGMVAGLTGAVYAGSIAFRSSGQAFSNFTNIVQNGGGVLAGIGSVIGTFRNKAIKDFTSVKRATIGFGTALRGVGVKAKTTGSILMSLGTTIGTVTSLMSGFLALAGVAGIGLGLGAALIKPGLNVASSFESEMARAKTVLQLTNEEMQKFSRLAIQMGKDTEFSATEAANTIYRIASATGSQELAESFLKPTLLMSTASNGALDLAASWSLLQQSMASFQMPETAEGAIKVVDTLAKATQTTNFEFNQFQAAIASAGDAIVRFNQPMEETIAFLAAIKKFSPTLAAQSGNIFGMALRSFTPDKRRLLDAMLSQNVGKAGAITRATDPLTGKFRSSIEIMKGLADVFGLTAETIKDEGSTVTRRAQTQLQQLFGSSFAMQALTLAVKTGFENIDEMAKSFKNVTGTAEEFARVIGLTHQVLTQKVGASAELVMKRFGDHFLRADVILKKFQLTFLNLTETILGAAPALTGVFSTILFLIQNIVKVAIAGIGTMFVLLGPALLNMAKMQLGLFILPMASHMAKAGNIWAANLLNGFSMMLNKFNFITFFKRLFVVAAVAEAIFLSWRHNIFGVRDAFQFLIGPITRTYASLRQVLTVVQTFVKEGKVLTSTWKGLTESQQWWVVTLTEAYYVVSAVVEGFAKTFEKSTELISRFFRWITPTAKAAGILADETGKIADGAKGLINVGKILGIIGGAAAHIIIPVVGLAWTFNTVTSSISNTIDAVRKLYVGIIQLISKIVSLVSVEKAQRMSHYANAVAARTEAASTITLGKSRMFARSALLIGGGAAIGILGGMAAGKLASGGDEEKARDVNLGTAIGTIAGGLIGGALGAFTTVGFGTGVGVAGGMALGGLLGGSLAGTFNEGGIVPGSPIQPVPIVAHGGEAIFNPSKPGGGRNAPSFGNKTISIGDIHVNITEKLDIDSLSVLSNPGTAGAAIAEKIMMELSEKISEDEFRSLVNA